MYILNLTEIKESFCGRTDGHTYIHTDICDPLYYVHSEESS